jgi:hypothetical protein
MSQNQLLDYIDMYIKAETIEARNVWPKDKSITKFDTKIDKKRARDAYISKYYRDVLGEVPVYDELIYKRVPHSNAVRKRFGHKQTISVENPAIVSFNTRLSKTKKRDYERFKDNKKKAQNEAVTQKYDCEKFKTYDDCVVDLNQCKWHPAMTHRDKHSGEILQKTEAECRDVLRMHDEDIDIHAFGKRIVTTPRALSREAQWDFDDVIPRQEFSDQGGESKIQEATTKALTSPQQRAILKEQLNSNKRGGKKTRKRTSVPQRYVPKNLSRKDKKIQRKQLKKSRKAYKNKKYHTRKKIKSFKSKGSPHVVKARKMYNIDKLTASNALAKATGCNKKVLQKMIQKGQGAYFSSGSRPNQTAHSWGRARMASGITGGKAAAVDYYLLKDNCKKNSKALKLAKKSLKKYNYGRRRVKQVKIGGKKTKKLKRYGVNMKEKIINLKKSTNKGKKYTASVKNINTGKERTIHFGGKGYEQFKDSTGLGHYSHVNHGTLKRKKNYFSRHSREKTKNKAVVKELKKSKGCYNAKILSHIYLW